MPSIEKLGPPQPAVAVVLDSVGVVITPDSWPRAYNYNGDGTLNYEECTDGASTWRKTYGYTSGKLTSETAWVKQ